MAHILFKKRTKLLNLRRSAFEKYELINKFNHSNLYMFNYYYSSYLNDYLKIIILNGLHRKSDLFLVLIYFTSLQVPLYD